MAPGSFTRFPQGSTFLLLLSWLPNGARCDGSLFMQDLLASWRGPGRTGMPASSLAIANGSIDIEEFRGGFRPSPIVDPKEDIDCEAQECTVEEGAHKARCTDWPERLCRSYEPCEGKTASGKVCLHKSFWPLLAEDAELFISLFLIATAAGATGIGGGGLNVPMLMLWSKFDIKEGVPLSHCAVLGNAFAMLLVNAPQRHPLAERRPLIYYELALLLLPAMLGGSSLGVIVGRIFPPALLIVLSIFLLVLTTAKTLVKARHIAKAARAREDNSSQGLLDLGLLNHADGASTPALALPWGVNQLSRNGDSNSGSGNGSSGGQMDHGTAMDSTARLESPTWVRTWSGEIVLVGRKQALLEELRERAVTRQARQRRLRSSPASTHLQSAPWAVIYLLILCSFGFTIDLVILKEQKYCTVGYWGFLAALYPILVAGVAAGIWALRRLDRQGAEMRADGDVAVTPKNMIVYPSITMLIGLVAGLLGLGGGEFTVPLLLELGLHSRVASATSGLLMVFMTLSNVIHYSIVGTLELFLGYASTLACIAFLGGLLGLFIRDRPYVQAHNYLMVYLLAVLLALAAVLLGARGWSSLREPTAWQFQGFCS